VRSEEETPYRTPASHPSLLTCLTPHPKVAIVAGEASGDLLGSLLINALKQAGLAADFFGIAGPKMQAAGARSLFPMEALSVRGYVEALGSLRKILGIRAALKGATPRRAPPPVHRRRRAGFQSVAGSRPETGRHSHRALHQPLHLGLAPQAHRKDPQGGVPRPAHLSLRGGPVPEGRHPGHLRRPPRRPRLARAPPAPGQGTIGLAPDEEFVVLMPGSRPGELKALAKLFIEPPGNCTRPARTPAS
jgi:hypothetical protein